jgi:hypothetical protein
VVGFLALEKHSGQDFILDRLNRERKGQVFIPMKKQRNYLKSCVKIEKGVFQSQQKIDKPTLLINANLETHNKFLRFIRLKEVLPITDFVKLRLSFQNLFTAEIPEIKDVPFVIEYPGGRQIRPWKINLPNLKNKDESCYSESLYFFKPEVHGVHRIVVEQIDGLQYADLFGVTDRDLKIIADYWTASFNIIGSLEMRLYITATLALIISILSLIIAVF